MDNLDQLSLDAAPDEDAASSNDEPKSENWTIKNFRNGALRKRVVKAAGRNGESTAAWVKDAIEQRFERERQITLLPPNGTAAPGPMLDGAVPVPPPPSLEDAAMAADTVWKLTEAAARAGAKPRVGAVHAAGRIVAAALRHQEGKPPAKPRRPKPLQLTHDKDAT